MFSFALRSQIVILFKNKSNRVCDGVLFFQRLSLTLLQPIRLLHKISKKKVRIGNDQEIAQSGRHSHSINRGVGKK